MKSNILAWLSTKQPHMIVRGIYLSEWEARILHILVFTLAVTFIAWFIACLIGRYEKNKYRYAVIITQCGNDEAEFKPFHTEEDATTYLENQYDEMVQADKEENLNVQARIYPDKWFAKIENHAELYVIKLPTA